MWIAKSEYDESVSIPFSYVSSISSFDAVMSHSGSELIHLGPLHRPQEVLLSGSTGSEPMSYGYLGLSLGFFPLISLFSELKDCDGNEFFMPISNQSRSY